MARARRTKSPIEREYDRERRNLKAMLKRREAAGFEIPDDFMPAKPKKVTAGSIRRLQKLKEKTKTFTKRHEYPSPTEEAWRNYEIPSAEQATPGGLIQPLEHGAAVIPVKKLGQGSFADIIRERAKTAMDYLNEWELETDYPNTPLIQKKNLQQAREMMDAYLFGYLIDGYSFSGTDDFISRIYEIITDDKLTAQQKRAFADFEDEEDYDGTGYDF